MHKTGLQKSPPLPFRFSVGIAHFGCVSIFVASDTEFPK